MNRERTGGIIGVQVDFRNREDEGKQDMEHSLPREMRHVELLKYTGSFWLVLCDGILSDVLAHEEVQCVGPPGGGSAYVRSPAGGRLFLPATDWAAKGTVRALQIDLPFHQLLKKD